MKRLAARCREPGGIVGFWVLGCKVECIKNLANWVDQWYSNEVYIHMVPPERLMLWCGESHTIHNFWKLDDEVSFVKNQLNWTGPVAFE